MTADFVAAILAGFEDTLDEVRSRVSESLRCEVAELRVQIEGKRERLESLASAPTHAAV